MSDPAQAIFNNETPTLESGLCEAVCFVPWNRTLVKYLAESTAFFVVIFDFYFRPFIENKIKKNRKSEKDLDMQLKTKWTSQRPLASVSNIRPASVGVWLYFAKMYKACLRVKFYLPAWIKHFYSPVKFKLLTVDLSKPEKNSLLRHF